jgi:porin
LAGVFGLTDDGTGTGGVTPAVVTGTGKAKANKTNWGLYAIIDQMLWREPVQKNCHCCEGKADSEQGLGFFYRVMGSPSDRNLIEFYTDGGLTYKGLLPTRDEDVVGVSVAYAQMGSGVRKAQRDTNAVNNGNTVLNGGLPRDNNGDGFLNRNDLNQRLPDFEMVLETTYQVHLAEWWYIQPDFQYVFHPGGSAQLPDAVVIGARTGIAF